MRAISPYNSLILAALCGILMLATFSMAEKRYASNTTLSKVDDFNFQSDTGETYALYDFKDKNLIIHFWASWCPPCRDELPALLHYMQAHPSHALLLVSSDRSREEMRRFLDDLRPLPENAITVWDESRQITQGRFNVSAYPETIFYDKQLVFRRHARGTVNWKNVD